jgi:uncharacterized protein (TIGR02757 family)
VPPRLPRALTHAQIAAIGAALDEVRARCDVAARRASDPVEFVHRYERLHDRELVALLASSFAFGNVKALRAKIEDALARIGADVALACDDPRALRRRLATLRHRLYRGEDVAALLLGARAVQRGEGSLGDALARRYAASGGDLKAALASWVAAIRAAGGLDRLGRERRGPAHLLADPEGASASKRIMLMLRWMVRPADGVDLGAWTAIPPSALVIPLDVHVHKLSRNLGLTSRATASWKAAEDVTRALARLDPDDPVKYDFSLCHLGMVQTCPSRRDPVRCDGCGVRPVCRHWRR